MIPKFSMRLTNAELYSLYRYHPYEWIKTAADPHSQQFLDIWSKQYEAMFKNFARKWAWLPNVDDAEGLFVDLWAHAWLKAVDKWDGKRNFDKWVKMIMGQYIKTLQAQSMGTERGKGQRATTSLDKPINTETGEGTMMDLVPEQLGQVIDELKDAEWLSDAVGRIEDDAVQKAVQVIIRHWGHEKPGDTWNKLRETFESFGRGRPQRDGGIKATRDYIEEQMAADPGVQYILRYHLGETGEPTETEEREYTDYASPEEGASSPYSPPKRIPLPPEEDDTKNANLFPSLF